jgi:mobilome CxxCx(11)CxxC protein
MNSGNLNEQQIKQIRLNALSAKYIHAKGIFRWKRYNLAIDILTLIVPLLLLVFPVLQINLIFGITLNNLTGVLSILLISLAVFKFTIKIPDKIEKHQELLTKNIAVAHEAQNILLNSTSSLNHEWLFRQAQILEAEDQGIIGNLNKKFAREAYRESLKELDINNNSVICPICKASPWNFKKGSCEACGNTPVNIKSHEITV